MDLAIVILNWNAAGDTVRCVRSISSWKSVETTILVVDNASSDNSISAISRECPEVRLVRSSVNLGFGGGSNKGIVEALSLGHARILLLNNDAQIGEGDIASLIKTLEDNGQVGLVGPLIFDAEDRSKLLAAGAKDPVCYHHSHVQELPANGPVHLVECVPGTALLGRARVFEEVGLLDEDYFYSSEVVDLCLRAREAGYSSAIDVRARAYHDLGRSSTLRSTLYPYYIIRNRFLLIRKFHPKWKLPLYGFWACYSSALSLKEQLANRPLAARAISLGLLDGLRGRFGNQNERVLGAPSSATS